ncbi:AAC(3) family N-acetyltransferase [Parasulfitobacter algicola]
MPPHERRATISICLYGLNAKDFLVEHSLAWATGSQTPLRKLCEFQSMKILLIGGGWNRCSAFHTAKTLAEHRRTKTRRFFDTNQLLIHHMVWASATSFD